MTLDEMIAWLDDERCRAASRAQRYEGSASNTKESWDACSLLDAAGIQRERAATLLAIENALREVQMEQFGEICEQAAEKIAAKVLREAWAYTASRGAA